MITIILGIMFLLALGALAIGLISFGIWLLPAVIVGIIVIKIIKLVMKKTEKPDVIVMDRKFFNDNYVKKETGEVVK